MTAASDGEPTDRDDLDVTERVVRGRRKPRRRWVRRLGIGSLVVVLVGIGYVGVTLTQSVTYAAG